MVDTRLFENDQSSSQNLRLTQISENDIDQFLKRFHLGLDNFNELRKRLDLEYYIIIMFTFCANHLN